MEPPGRWRDDPGRPPSPGAFGTTLSQERRGYSDICKSRPLGRHSARKYPRHRAYASRTDSGCATEVVHASLCCPDGRGRLACLSHNFDRMLPRLLPGPTCSIEHRGEVAWLKLSQFKYRAFLSYSHRDQTWAKWLHSSLERYRIDKSLVGRSTPVGLIPKTLRPIFRDREDFSAGHSLNERTLEALQASEFLVVLCSENACKSPYVDEEVRQFKLLSRSDRIIPVIIGGEPNDPERQCFPPSLRFKVRSDGSLTNQLDEPIAADARSSGDGREVARLKVVSGLLGLNLDEIVQRADRARRRKTTLWTSLAATFVLLTAISTVTAIYAYKNLLKSEERLDQAIEIAYGFVSEASSLSDRFGVPTDLVINLLRRADGALTELISRGAQSQALQLRKALMLISFSESYFNLGQTQDASNRALEASQILQMMITANPNNNTEWKATLQRVQNELGFIAEAQRDVPSAAGFFQSSLRTGQGLIDERAENIGIISQFITTRINLGDLLVTHSTAEGTEQYQRSIDEIIKFTKIEDTGNKLVDLTTAITTQPSFQPLAFEATKRLSFIKITQGLFADAINYSKAILAFREGASLSNPDSIRLQEGLADSYIELGNAYLEAGLIDFAMESFTKSASIAGKLSQTDSKNVIYKRIAALAKDGIGRAMLSKGAVDDALDVFTANVEYAKPFVLADKTNKLWAAVLGIGHERVGDALMLQEKFLDAAQQYQIEHDLVSSAVSANPDEDTTWQMRLAIADFKFAKALIGEGKRTAAIPLLSKKCSDV